MKEYRNRDANLYAPEQKGPTIRKIIKRLCGKGRDIHNICHLYITYGYVGYGHLLEEKIDIADMCIYEEKPGVYDEELGEYIYDVGDDLYIGGCANAERNGIVTVQFGACCADEVKRIVEKEKYSVKIKDFS